MEIGAPVVGLLVAHRGRVLLDRFLGRTLGLFLRVCANTGRTQRVHASARVIKRQRRWDPETGRAGKHW